MDYCFIVALLNNIREIMSERKEELINLDSVVGDGDLGLTMSDGFQAAYAAVAAGDEKDIGKLLYAAGKAMSSAVPSTMGTLMASGLMNAGKALKGETEMDLSKIVQLFQAYFDGVANRGKAKVGEKTFLDGLFPAVQSLNLSAQSGQVLDKAVESAADAAQKGYDDTETMLAVHGRAATRGEASKNMKDPGAAVAVLIMMGLKQTVEEARGN